MTNRTRRALRVALPTITLLVAASAAAAAQPEGGVNTAGESAANFRCAAP